MVVYWSNIGTTGQAYHEMGVHLLAGSLGPPGGPEVVALGEAIKEQTRMAKDGFF